MIETGKKCSVKECYQPIRTGSFCHKHYQRWLRHGHEYDTRPSDWGAREEHPLYILYCGLQRGYRNQLCEKWKDFWGFVEDIKERPKSGNPQLRRKNESQQWCLENVFWKERRYATGNEKEYAREWRKNNKRKCHDRELKRLYGIGVDEYEKMLVEQNNLCKLCGKAEASVDHRTKKIRRLAVDHCHNSSKVRALLCSQCNKALGNFKDDISLLTKAIEYIKSYT